MHHSIDRHPPHWLVLNIFIFIKSVTHFDKKEAFKIQYLVLGIFPFYVCVWVFFKFPLGLGIKTCYCSATRIGNVLLLYISLPLFSFVPPAIVLFTVSLNYPFIFKFTIPFSSEAEMINLSKKGNNFGLFSPGSKFTRFCWPNDMQSFWCLIKF